MSLSKQEKLKLRSSLSLSKELDLIARLAAEGAVELDKIVREIGPRGHAILSFVLVLPFLQPIPLAGLSTIAGLVIGAFGYFLALDVAPRLPARLGQKRVSAETLIRISEAGHKILVRIERFIRPRGIGLRSSSVVRVFSGIVISICGVLLALPLPIPLSNAIPGWTIAVVSLGAIERDGLLLLIGYFLFLATLVFFAALVLLPYLGLSNGQELLRGFGL